MRKIFWSQSWRVSRSSLWGREEGNRQRKQCAWKLQVSYEKVGVLTFQNLKEWQTIQLRNKQVKSCKIWIVSKGQAIQRCFALFLTVFRISCREEWLKSFIINVGKEVYWENVPCLQYMKDLESGLEWMQGHLSGGKSSHPGERKQWPGLWCSR